jgi:hypothetical protein
MFSDFMTWGMIQTPINSRKICGEIYEVLQEDKGRCIFLSVNEKLRLKDSDRS